MYDFQHQHIVDRFNFRQVIEAENAAIDDIERRAKPLVYALTIVALAVITNAIYTDRQDYAQAVKDAAASSALLAHCANGNSFAVGKETLIRCSVSELVVGVE